MSESERKLIIDQILRFPANRHSREYLEQPHPKTGPYSVSSLSEYLKELQQAAGKSERKTQPQVQQSSEEARIQAQQVWEYFFSHHLEILDNAANRRALFERGLSLSDDEMVRPVHLDEAAKLLIAEGTIRTKKVLTAAELKQQAVKDLETFKLAAVQLGFGANIANERLVRDVLGSGFSIDDIAQAISSNAIQLAPASQEEIEKWREEAVQARNEWFSDNSVDLEQRKAVARQILSETRDQAVQVQAERELDAAKTRHEAGNFRPLPPEIDRKAILGANGKTLREWVRIYGDYQITKVVRGIQ